MRLSEIIKEETEWWMVLAKNGVFQVVSENDPTYLKLVQDGWDLIWDSARTPEQGMQRAEAQGLHPWDRMNPIALSEPRVLYRAVSPAELTDILKRGVITGRGNRFNDFDSRRWVFFGADINDGLLYQGEEIERQAVVSLENNRIHAKFDKLQADALAIKTKRVEIAKEFASRMRLNLTDRDQDEFARNMVPSFVHGRILTRSPEYEKLVAAGEKIVAKERELRAEFKALHKAEMEAMKAKAETLPFTVAVVVTKPLSGGVHYSPAHGKSGMGNDDEFGFPSGRVTLDDISEIRLYKNREVVSSGTPAEIAKLLKIRGGTK